MSKIGQEAAAVMYDDMGEPVVFKGRIDENGIYIPTPEEEAEAAEAFEQMEKQRILSSCTVEELEEELDSRITNTSDVEARQARRSK